MLILAAYIARHSRLVDNDNIQMSCELDILSLKYLNLQIQVLVMFHLHISVNKS